jgi:hypothetical protein
MNFGCEEIQYRNIQKKKKNLEYLMFEHLNLEHPIKLKDLTFMGLFQRK